MCIGVKIYMKEYYKICPCCNETKMIYKNKQNLNHSLQRNVKCHKCKEKMRNSCSTTRNCPTCGQEIFYKSKFRKNFAERKKSECRACISSTEEFKNRARKTMTELNKKFKEIGFNGFKGKKHSEEFKKRASQSRVGIPCPESVKKKLKDFYKTHKGAMTGKNLYSIWIEKYGKEIADLKMQEYKEKQSRNNSGKNNPMYNKPAPAGSGNGWKGWFNDIFFRSLRELMYLIFLQENNIIWENAEKNKFSVEYVDFFGKKRTYFADYFINNSVLVEIKPFKLQKTKSVILKKEAAEKFCLERGWTYILIDIEIDPKKIHEYFVSGNIKFMDKYYQKYLNYISNKIQ